MATVRMMRALLVLTVLGIATLGVTSVVEADAGLVVHECFPCYCFPFTIDPSGCPDPLPVGARVLP